jgi:hypothetical protein
MSENEPLPSLSLAAVALIFMEVDAGCSIGTKPVARPLPKALDLPFEPRILFLSQLGM